MLASTCFSAGSVCKVLEDAVVFWEKCARRSKCLTFLTAPDLRSTIAEICTRLQMALQPVLLQVSGQSGGPAPLVQYNTRTQ